MPGAATLLILLVCMTGDPTVCKSEKTYVSYPSPFACMLGAQPEAARWLDDHPGWTLKSILCQNADDEHT